MRARDTLRLVAGTLVLGAIVIGIALALHAGGLSIGAALHALMQGSVGSVDAFASGTLVRATPLVLTGLAVSLAFRGGVFNIGAEGQFLVGAATATAVALAGVQIPGATWLMLTVAGAVGGAAWASIAGWLRVRFGVLEVISTILLNFVALYLIGYLVHGPLQEPMGIYPQSEALPTLARAPRILPATRLHAGFAVATLLCVGAWWYLRSTAAGFRLRTVGANPRAAAAAGRIDVNRVTLLTFAMSGGLAGAAGALEVAGTTFALYENISPGYGFTAIAVALLANLRPLGVIAAGIFFGALESGGNAMQRDAGMPSVMVSVLEATFILLILVVRRSKLLPTLRAWRTSAEVTA